MSEEWVQDIVKKPDGVYVSSSGNNNTIFAGNKTGAYKGQAITTYGSLSPKGYSGTAIHGGSPNDPSLLITSNMIINGKISIPDGVFLPVAHPVSLGG